MMTHIKLNLERRTAQGYPKVGLGFFSEQSFESIHGKWTTHWSRYAVGQDHADYNDHLLKAVVSLVHSSI